MGIRSTTERTIDALNQCDGNKTAAAKLLGISRSAIRSRLDRAARYGLDGSAPEAVPPGEIIKSRSTLYSIDPEAGATKIMEWIKTREDPNYAHLHDAIVETFEAHKGYSVLPPPPIYTDEDLLSLYVLADFHLGLYAWGEEAGQDYDVDVACETLRGVMRELVASTPPAETAIILNLGDFFHADSNRGETVKGTRVDVDTRYARVLSFGVQLMVETVELALQRHRRVVLRNLRGNHDEHSSIALTAAMGAWFNNDDRVTVDVSPAAHWSYRFGQTLLGATHGDTLKKPENMAMLLAAGCPEDWGRSRFRYFHYGHIHQLGGKEVGGVLVECHRTLAAKDAWGAGQGFLSGRSMSSITYHRERGEQSRWTVNIPHWNE